MLSRSPECAFLSCLLSVSPCQICPAFLRLHSIPANHSIRRSTYRKRPESRDQSSRVIGMRQTHSARGCFENPRGLAFAKCQGANSDNLARHFRLHTENIKSPGALNTLVSISCGHLVSETWIATTHSPNGLAPSFPALGISVHFRLRLEGRGCI
jgi:hypothetical protein